MSSLYFNHRFIEDSNNSFDLEQCFNELALMTAELRKAGLDLFLCKSINTNFDIFYKKLNSISLETKQAIYQYLSNANYYPIDSDSLVFNTVNCFIEMCFTDNQQVFTSLSKEVFLNEAEYNYQEFIIKNIIGLTNLQLYIQQLAPPLFFKDIKIVFEQLEQKYPDKIIFLNDAIKSARKETFDTDMRKKIYIALEKAIEVLLPHNTNDLKPFESLYKDVTSPYSFDMSQESPETLNQYGHRRTFCIDGESKIFSNHIKIWNKRIHFYIENEKLYIGYCGNHLPTATRNN